MTSACCGSGLVAAAAANTIAQELTVVVSLKHAATAASTAHRAHRSYKTYYILYQEQNCYV
jgi:hypothetical protein